MSTQVNGVVFDRRTISRGLDERGNPIYMEEGQEPDNNATRKD